MDMCPFDTVTWIRTADALLPILQVGNLRLRDIMGLCEAPQAFTNW